MVRTVSAITVATWVEIMAETPEGLSVQTREFLRTFERLAISEGISDRALALIQKHPGLKLRHAIAWATALANELIYITRDLPHEQIEKSFAAFADADEPETKSAVP